MIYLILISFFGHCTFASNIETTTVGTVHPTVRPKPIPDQENNFTDWNYGYQYKYFFDNAVSVTPASLIKMAEDYATYHMELNKTAEKPILNFKELITTWYKLFGWKTDTYTYIDRAATDERVIMYFAYNHVNETSYSKLLGVRLDCYMSQKFYDCVIGMKMPEGTTLQLVKSRAIDQLIAASWILMVVVICLPFLLIFGALLCQCFRDSNPPRPVYKFPTGLRRRSLENQYRPGNDLLPICPNQVKKFSVACRCARCSGTVILETFNTSSSSAIPIEVPQCQLMSVD